MVILIQPPANAKTTLVMAPAIVIGFMDAFGNIVSGAGITVSVAASAGTMSGTTSVQADITGTSIFRNLIFDDIANTIISTRTLTFSAAGMANVVSAGVVVVKGSLQTWLEADFGVVDSDGSPLTAWGDRSGNGNNGIPGTGMTAPTFRASGFGGITNMPYWEFVNVNGLRTGLTVSQAQTTFTNFVVGLRDVADSNGIWYEYQSNTIIAAGIRVQGPSLYAARMPSITLLESSYNEPGWIPTNTRKLFRHEFDGTNAGHKLYDNGVQKVFASNPLVNNPGVVTTNFGDFHVGYRDSGTPSLNLRGKIAALLAFSPQLSQAEAQSVEAYLQKWLGGAPANPTPQRGPILLSNSVIDGVTIQVLNWSAAADIKSTDSQIHSLIFLFSQPIKRFAATLNSPGSIPSGGYKMLIGANAYQSLFNYTYITSGSYGASGQRVQINDTATGFTAVILRDSLTPGNAPAAFGDSILQNCRFSIMSDP